MCKILVAGFAGRSSHSPQSNSLNPSKNQQVEKTREEDGKLSRIEKHYSSFCRDVIGNSNALRELEMAMNSLSMTDLQRARKKNLLGA